MKSLFACSLTLALGFSALPAFATTLTIGGTSIAGAGMTSSIAPNNVQTFDSGILTPDFSINGPGGIVSGSSMNVYKAPDGDSSPYLTTGTGSVTARTYAGGVNYVGFYWGSVDTYNTFTLTTTTGVAESFTGASLIPLGVTVDGNHSAYVNFFAAPNVYWNQAVFSSTQNAFEIDNVAAAAPEPASLAMIASGFLALAAGAFRRRTQHIDQA